MAEVNFNGEGQNLNRITAKKNYASSMQSHKMGACMMFNLLHKYMGENMYPDLINEVNGNYAVEQHPVLVFQDKKLEGTDDYEQKYIGLYTVGADKGDKGYFGFTDPRVADKAVRLEGTDHLKGVGFNYPWRVNGTKTIRYNHDKEALCIVTGEDRTKWTAILEQSYCGNAETESEIEAHLESKFMPVFELAYNNNPLLVGTTMSIGAINADIEGFKKLRRTDGRPYSLCEFWIDGEYDVYYLNQERNQYEKNGYNLYEVLSNEDKAKVDAASSLDEKNEIFIAHRVKVFREEAENYICVNDALFMILFCLVIVASDNFEKNMYPYILDMLLRFFQDDLDSIFSTDNQAQDTKSYSAELHDFTDETQSAYVFKGEDNSLVHLIEKAYPERFAKMGKDMLQAIYDLSPKGTKTLDRLNGFFDMVFFDRAQNYFPISAYNNDAEVAYEEAWNDKNYVASVDIHPLAQSLGNHYTTERRFINLRNVYLMSKFGFGGFASYEDNSLGIISIRTQDPVGFTLTPAIDLYPTILGGQGQISKADRRIKAGEAVTLPAVGGGNTNVYIVAADYLTDIGDLKDLPIDPSSVVALNVSSKRLRRLKVGDEVASAVTSYLGGLNIQQCDSLETIDARNLVSLKGEVDLSKCPRLYSALFKGTSVVGVNVPKGSKIEVLTLPDTITKLSLVKLQKLTLDNLDYGTLANLAYLRVEDNAQIDGFAMLKMAISNGNLEAVRVLGINAVGTSEDLKVLEALAESGAKGINADGEVDANLAPIVEGTLILSGQVNGKLYDKVVPLFPSLEIVATDIVYAIEFEDPEVERICVENWGSDGMITYDQAKNVTELNSKFSGNTDIRYFNELEYFSNVVLEGNQFSGCSSLVRVRIPSSVTSILGTCFARCVSLESINLDNVKIVGTDYGRFISSSVFYGCQKLVDLGDTSNVEQIGARAFYQCYSLEKFNAPNLKGKLVAAFTDCYNLKYVNTHNVEEIGGEYTNPGMCFSGCHLLKSLDLSNAKILNSGALNIGQFAQTSITTVNLPKVNTIANYGLAYMYVLNKVIIGSECTSISTAAFADSTPTIVINSTVPPEIASGVFTYIEAIYVPDESVESYKENTNWIDFASKIKPMSEKPVSSLVISPYLDKMYNNSVQLNADFDGVTEDVTWSIISGSSYATISQEGLLTFNDGVKEGSIVRVKAVSKKNSSLMCEHQYEKANVTIEHGVALQSNGTTTPNETMSTVGFVPIDGAAKILIGVSGGKLGTSCTYTEEGVLKGYNSTANNPRASTISDAALIKVSFSTEYLENAYIIDVHTGKYLWAGSNVL